MAETDNKKDKTLSMTSAFESMAKGFFATFETLMPFQPESKALGGSKTPGKVIGKEDSTPLGDVSNFFAGIDKSLIDLVTFAKKSFGLEEKSAQQKNLDKQNTDPIGPMPQSTGSKVLETLTEAFSGMGEAMGNMSVGEKMGAALLVGGLLIFNNLQDELSFILTPIVAIMKGLVNFLGVGGTFNLFLVTFLAFKVGLAQFVIKLAARKMGFTTLSAAFKSLQLFLGTTLPKSILSTFKAGPMALATKLLGGAFKLLRLMLTATMYPAIIGMVSTLAAAMGPILGPIVVIAAIAAGIGAVLFSIKSGIEAFKNSLESGDSMILAIGKGLLDFSATLITLPITLLKNLLGYIAGLLGFDGIKEAIDNFSFKDMIVNAFTSLIGGTIRLIKAIAKGAGAALAAAFPGGEGPGEAFSRVFKEVMSGGEGTMPDEKPEQGKGINRLDTSEMDIDIVSPNKIKSNVFETAQAATSSSESFNTTNYKFDNSKTVMANKIENIEQGKTTLEALKFKRDNESKAPIMVNNNRGGDTNVTNNTANVSGELQLHHTDKTSRLINSAIA